MSNLSLLGLGSGKTLLLAGLDIDLGQSLARVDELDDVDELLDEHEREADASNDPGDGGIHLVGSGQFESGGAEGIREDLLQNRRVDLGTGLELGADLLDRLD